MSEKIPTKEGVRRYPPSGLFNPYADPNDATVCTCVPDCADPCLGQCGCQACIEAWKLFQAEGEDMKCIFGNGDE